MVAASFAQRGGRHLLAGMIDHGETYGAHVIDRFARSLPDVRSVVDLGAGSGRDLGIIKAAHPEVETCAIEANEEYATAIRGKVDRLHFLDIERDPLPFADESIDLINANQMLEHLKEIFWVFHEVFRSLKVGGHFMFGVPNVASLHNRLLLLAGVHPTQHKLASAHVRPFSKGDTIRFLEACIPGQFTLAGFAGSQFYPLPRPAARLAAATFPTMAFSIFFLVKKVTPYDGGFAKFPTRAQLETNFWTGDDARFRHG